MKTHMKILLAGGALALLTTVFAQNFDPDDAPTNAPPLEQANDTNETVAPGNFQPAPLQTFQPEVFQIAPEPERPQAEPPTEPRPEEPSGPAMILAAPQTPETLVAPSERAQFTPPANGAAGNNNELRLNFRGAPIEMVLNYLSDAAGFIIELNTPVRGRVDIWSNQPVTKEEALELLSSVLNKNGYAVVRNGRVLRIMNRNDAIHSNIPVKVGNEPSAVPQNEEIVTQIIPIRYVEARQLLADLSPMISPRATLVANEAGNSIVITDTQANIRHVMELIKAIDSNAEDVTEVRVYHLRHHDPVEVANILANLFADQGGNAGNQSPIRFGGFGGGGGGGGGRFGGGGPGAAFRAAIQAAGNQNNQNSRIRKRARVIAVPDQRTSSVVVTAPKDLIDQIEDMVTQIDRESPKVGRVSVVHLEHADPQRVQQVLQDMFQTTNTRNNRNNQNSVLMNRGGATQNQQNTINTGFGNQGFGGGNLNRIGQ